MGSGCTTNNTSGGLFQSGISDKGVKYTGPGIPALGICNSDTLAEIEAVILQRIIDYSTGKKICIENIDLKACDLFVNEQVSCCESDCIELDRLIEIIFDALCTLYTDIKDLKDAFDDFNSGYVASCIAGLTINSTLKQTLQLLLTEFCALKARVTTLETTVSTLSSGIPTTIGNFLLSAIQSCQSQVVKSGTGASATITFKGFVPIGGVIPYAGPLTVFDASGLGLPNTEMCGWAMCNGLNGTVNMSGLVPVGTGMGPAVITGMVFPYNTTGGEYGVTLTGPQCGLQSHTHGLTDGGHAHPLNYTHDSTGSTGNAVQVMNPNGTTDVLPWYDASTNTTHPPTGSNPYGVVANIGKAKTGIEIAASGSLNAQLAHNNVQPYRALYYIQRIA